MKPYRMNSCQFPNRPPVEIDQLAKDKPARTVKRTARIAGAAALP